MKYIVVAAAAISVSLSGCAFLPSKVTQLDLTVDRRGLSATAPLRQQIYDSLSLASAQRAKFIEEYNRLYDESLGRDAAIFAASVGLSATSVFHGDANSLRWAGYMAGLTTFYDKSIPISGRIAAAQSAINNYGYLITTGNLVLASPVDDDKNALVSGISSLSGDIKIANNAISLDKPPAITNCPNPADSKACQTDLDAQSAAIKSHQDELNALKNTIANAQNTLTKATSALNALNMMSPTINKTDFSINSVGMSGIAITVNWYAASFSATAPASTGIAKPAAVVPGDTLATQNNVLLVDAAQLQSILDRVDYVALSAQISSAAPVVGSNASAQAPSPASATQAKGATP